LPLIIVNFLKKNPLFKKDFQYVKKNYVFLKTLQKYFKIYPKVKKNYDFQKKNISYFGLHAVKTSWNVMVFLWSRFWSTQFLDDSIQDLAAGTDFKSKRGG
jgi:hypothetical protein